MKKKRSILEPKKIRLEVIMNKLITKFKNFENLNMMRNLVVCLFVLFASISVTNAQQDNLGNEQINVVKAYQPMLSDAFKISDVPFRDTAVNYVPDMNYEIGNIKYPTDYTISPIKPLKIKDDNIKKLYRGFVKAGYGTKNTPYAEIFYNSLRSKSIDAGVHLNHISSTGKIKNYGYPGMSETGINLYGTKFYNGGKLGAEIGYNRSVYHWYGYNNPPDILSKSATKHSFDDIYGNVTIQSNDKDKDALRYKGTVSFYSFSDNKSNSENDFIFAGTVGKKINDFDLGADITLDFLKFETVFNSSENRTIVRIDPRFVKTFDRMTLTAGANIPIEINDLTKYHLYPHVRLDFNLIEETMNVFAQLSGNLERVSYKSPATQNPFLGEETGTFNNGDVFLKNTNTKLDVMAGINVKLDKQLAFMGSFRMKRMNDDVFFKNLPTQVNSLVEYDVFYDNNTQTNIHAEVIYDQGEKTGVSIAADYFGNNTSREDQPLFRPDFKFAASGYYVMSEKIYFNAQLAYVTPRYFRNYDASGLTYDYKTIKGYFDANIGVDYRYSKVLSVFANINNLTASKYGRWYNYPSYGFGFMAGLSYAF
jgi:hypothetical protein